MKTGVKVAKKVTIFGENIRPGQFHPYIIYIYMYYTGIQKVADAADISVLFFSAGANFWVIFGPFLAILGHFLWQNMPLCYLNHFLQLCCHNAITLLVTTPYLISTAHTTRTHCWP